jgi:hypothetical protein
MGAPPVGAPLTTPQAMPPSDAQVRGASPGGKAGPLTHSGLNPQTLQPLQKDGDTPPFL